MTDCGTSQDFGGGAAQDPTPLSRPASWRDYEEYEQWLARDAARLEALAALPRRLTIDAAAEFLQMPAGDIQVAIEAGQLAAVTVDGERFVLTRALLTDLGVRMDGPAS